MFEITTARRSNQPPINEINISGIIDGAASPQFRKQLFKAITPNQRDFNNVIVDCHQLEVIHPSGLRVLLEAVRLANNHQQVIVLAECKPRIKDTLAYVGFGRIVTLTPTTQEALEMLGQR